MNQPFAEVSYNVNIPLALEHIKALVEYAYEHGYHELGYNPVADAEAHIALQAQRVAELERELAGYRPMRADGKSIFPFTHWSKDPLIPYFGCDCGSCEDARRQVAVTASSHADGGES